MEAALGGAHADKPLVVNSLTEELKFEPRLLVGVATRWVCRVVLLRVGGRGTRLHPSSASPSVSSLCVGALPLLLCCVTRVNLRVCGQRLIE